MLPNLTMDDSRNIFRQSAELAMLLAFSDTPNEPALNLTKTV